MRFKANNAVTGPRLRICSIYLIAVPSPWQRAAGRLWQEAKDPSQWVDLSSVNISNHFVNQRAVMLNDRDTAMRSDAAAHNFHWLKPRMKIHLRAGRSPVSITPKNTAK